MILDSKTMVFIKFFAFVKTVILLSNFEKNQVLAITYAIQHCLNL